VYGASVELIDHLLDDPAMTSRVAIVSPWRTGRRDGVGFLPALTSVRERRRIARSRLAGQDARPTG